MTGILCLLLIVFVAPSILFPEYPGTSTYAAAGHLLFVLAAALLFWSTAVAASAGEDSIYYRISIALFVWSAAIVLRVFETTLHQPAYGTVADAFWVAGYLGLGVGTYGWFRRAGPTRGLILWIGAITISAFGVISYLFLSPLEEDSSRSTLLKTLDFFYIAVDVIILGFLSAPASKAAWPGSRFMLCGVLILLGSDLLFIRVATIPDSLLNRYLDIPYTVGDFMLALAASKQRAMLLPSHPG